EQPTTANDDPGVIVGDHGLARPVRAISDPLMQEYTDTELGMPVHEAQRLFQRLSVQAVQGGLSRATLLRKRRAVREAFADSQPGVVARFDDDDVARLMQDASIVRNQKKIAATINNAQATIKLREKGGLAKFIWSFQPEETPQPRTMAEVPTKSAES